MRKRERESEIEEKILFSSHKQHEINRDQMFSKHFILKILSSQPTKKKNKILSDKKIKRFIQTDPVIV